MVEVGDHESSHEMDAQDIANGANYSDADKETYANNFGENLANYTDFALDINNVENYNGGMPTTYTQASSKDATVIGNTKEFDGLDKSQGDYLAPLIVEKALEIQALNTGAIINQQRGWNSSSKEKSPNEIIAAGLDTGFKNLARNVKTIAQKGIEKNVMEGMPGMAPFFLASKLFGQDSVLPLSTGGHDDVDAVGTRFENIPDVRDFVDPYAGDNDTYEAPQQYINVPEVVTNDQYTTPISGFDSIIAYFSAKPKKKAATANIDDIIETPDSHPEKFRPLGNNQGQVNIKTNEIWELSTSNHSHDPVGEYKVGYKKGKPPEPTKKITIKRSTCSVYKRDKC